MMFKLNKQILLGLLLFVAQSCAWGQVYTKFGPSNGLMIGNISTYQTSSYAGTSCTNQFPRSLNGSGVASCNSVSLSSDVTGTLPATEVGAAGSSTQIQTNVSGVLGTDPNFTFTGSTQTLTLGKSGVGALIQPLSVAGSGVGVSIRSGISSISGGSGNLSIATPNAVTSGNGGSISIVAGIGAGTTGNGGAMSIDSGNGVNGGSGGNFTFGAGSGVSGNAPGGNFTLAAGSASGNQIGGGFVMTSGNGGASTGSFGGDFQMTGGSGVAGGGNFLMTAGPASGVGGQGGSVLLQAGTGDVQADDGVIILQSAQGLNSLTLDIFANAITVGAFADQGYSHQTPTTGFNITISNNIQSLILHPSCSPCATGTIVMPAKPIDGQTIEILTDKTITALTVNPNAGQTIINTPTTLALGTSFSYRWIATDNEWYRRF